MNQLLRYRDGSKSLLILTPTTQKAAGQLFRQAKRIVARSIVQMTHATANELPPQVIAGAEVLQAISKASFQPVVICPKEAYEAFSCCVYITTEVELLPKRLLRPLITILWLMADCFVVTLDVGSVPALEALPRAVKMDKVVTRLYPKILSCGGKCELSLAEATRLIDALEPATIQSLQMLRFECFYVAQGFRLAIQVIEEAIP